MSEIADFLRARYEERRQQENAKRRRIPSVFDSHDIEFRYTMDEGEQLLVDGHPFPADQFWETASEPAPDREAIAGLDAKLRILDEVIPEIDAMEARIDGEWGAGDPGERESMALLRLLAQSFVAHPDHKGEEWAP